MLTPSREPSGDTNKCDNPNCCRGIIHRNMGNWRNGREVKRDRRKEKEESADNVKRDRYGDRERERPF